MGRGFRVPLDFPDTHDPRETAAKRGAPARIFQMSQAYPQHAVSDVVPGHKSRQWLISALPDLVPYWSGLLGGVTDERRHPFDIRPCART
jgi:hypothetical protein